PLSDPSVTFDQYGNLFLCYLDNPTQNIVLALSTDGGQHFSTLSRSLAVGDQPTVTTGPGSVWVAYQYDPNLTGNAVMAARGAAVPGLAAGRPFAAPGLP